MREQTLSNKPLAVDLYCGLGGWTEGLLAEGFRVVGFDIERHAYGEAKYPAQLVIQDVLTIHGSQFKTAALIVASPPCQEYSYMAMPWSRAKAIAADYRSGKRDVADLTRLFDACFRIQREASEAAGHHIPMVVENVRGAIPWVGRSRWNFGSFHLWGDVPALMPIINRRPVHNHGVAHRSNGATNFHGHSGGNDGSGTSPAFNDTRHEAYKTVGIVKKRDGHGHTRHLTNQRESDGVKNGGDWFGSGADCSLQRHFSGTKQPGIGGPRANGKGDAWFQDGAAKHGSKSNARKAASAMIAKIPLTLSQHIAKVYHP